jgi:L-threonylcarbamoyladenylate synthase
LILTLDQCLPGGSGIDLLIDVISREGTLGYPAETMYGLGGDGLSSKVIDSIHMIKNRDERKGVILLIDTIERAEELCANFPSKAGDLARKYWPGPLTLLLEAAESLPAAEGGKIALRMPRPDHIREWVRLSDRPLASTSANAVGGSPARSPETLRTAFLEKVDLLVLGPTFGDSDLPSTIVDATIDPPAILRQGALSINS